MKKEIVPVISGFGSVCHLGVGGGLPDNLPRPLLPVDSWPAGRCRFAAFVEKFHPKDVVQGLKTRRLDKLSVWTLVASSLALSDAGVDPQSIAPSRKAVVFGTGFGCVTLTEEFLRSICQYGCAQSDPILFPETLDNFPAAHVARQFDFQGQNITLSARGISGEAALIMASDLILSEEVDLAVVASGDVLTRSLVEWYEEAKIISSQTSTRKGRVRPFYPENDGFIPGEGVCAVILEPMHKVERRKARPFAVFRGGMLKNDPAASSLGWSHHPEMLTGPVSNWLGRNGEAPVDLIISGASGAGPADRLERRIIDEIAETADIVAPKSLTGEFDGSALLRLASALSGIGPGMTGQTIFPDNRNLKLREMGRSEVNGKRALLLGTAAGGGKAALLFDFC